MKHRSAGLLPALAFGTLFVFYLMWAAMHDIAHGETGCTFEYSILAFSVPAFILLYAGAMTFLTRGAKIAWLGGTGILLALFCAGGVHARLYPKYPADPMLAAWFLAGGLPALALIACHLVRAMRSR